MTPQFIVNKHTPVYNCMKDIIIKHYEYTQVGYFIIVAIVAAMLAIGIILATTGTNLIAITVLVVLAVAVMLREEVILVGLWQR